MTVHIFDGDFIKVRKIGLLQLQNLLNIVEF